MFPAVVRIGIRNKFKAVNNLNNTNKNEVYYVCSQEFRAMPPVKKLKKIVLRIGNVSKSCLFHRLHFAVILRKTVDFAKMSNSTGRGWPTNL